MSCLIWGSKRNSLCMEHTGLQSATYHWEIAEPLLITKGSDLKYYVRDVWGKLSRTD